MHTDMQWTPHRGAACPVAADAAVEVRSDDGATVASLAGDLDWHPEAMIRAYRVLTGDAARFVRASGDLISTTAR
jgi:hypothetical protein